MKLPTINVGIPYGSLRIVNEKQQLIMPSSRGASGCGSAEALPLAPAPWLLLLGAGVPETDVGRFGLKRNTQEVRTAFWFVSNATWPYFCVPRRGPVR